MTDQMPIPKFNIGDSVYRASTVQTTAQLPCPDCLGTQEWKAVTPGGAEFSVACPRCSDGYIPQGEKLPSLKYTKHEPSVQKLTIGQIKIEWPAPAYDKDRSPVKYMCYETGIGSGNIYNEDQFFATEDLALAAAKLLAASADPTEAKKPEATRKMKFSMLSLREAYFTAMSSAVYSSWYHYRRLREEIEALSIDGTHGEALREIFEWEDKGREPPAIGKLINAAQAVADAQGVEMVAYEQIMELRKLLTNLGDLATFKE